MLNAAALSPAALLSTSLTVDPRRSSQPSDDVKSGEDIERDEGERGHRPPMMLRARVAAVAGTSARNTSRAR
jgi:hypothetical protein